jgi:hypothetical protein
VLHDGRGQSAGSVLAKCHGFRGEKSLDVLLQRVTDKGGGPFNTLSAISVGSLGGSRQKGGLGSLSGFGGPQPLGGNVCLLLGQVRCFSRFQRSQFVDLVVGVQLVGLSQLQHGRRRLRSGRPGSSRRRRRRRRSGSASWRHVGSVGNGIAHVGEGSRRHHRRRQQQQPPQLRKRTRKENAHNCSTNK